MYPNRPSGRKRWIIHGAKGSLRRLRSELAGDGCVESQFILAKQLLEEECVLESDKISNFKQALDWLICATEQGHEEGRKLLRRCVRSGVLGDNSSSIIKAKSCLAANRQETIARKAARDLFASLSNGEEYITTEQLEKRIREICNVELAKQVEQARLDDEFGDVNPLNRGGDILNEANGSMLEAGDPPLVNGLQTNELKVNDAYDNCTPERNIQNLTVDNLVTAAIDYCQGELPLVSYDLTLTDPSIHALDHIPLLQQAFLHPILFFQVLYLKLLYYFGSCSLSITNLELAVMIIAYCVMGTDNLSLIAPLIIYYLSFLYMVVSTFKMLHSKRQFIDFRKWSGLFFRYSEGNLHPEESENLFIRNNLGPIFHFFLALIVNLFLHPFVAKQWIAYSEFSVVSFFLMFMTLFSFNIGSPNVLTLFSFALNVLAKYPYDDDTYLTLGVSMLPIIPPETFSNIVIFCNRVNTYVAMFVPVVLFAMARLDKWQGFFKYVLPHCVTLSWLQMLLLCSEGATIYGLVRSTLAMVCVFLFLPIMGIVTLILPVVAFLQCLTLSDIISTIAVIVGFSVFFGGSCILAKMDSTKKYLTPFQLSMGLIAFVYLTSKFLVSNENLTINKNFVENDYTPDYLGLTWEDYHQNCHTTHWSIAASQIKCSILGGASVYWSGRVRDVRLHKVENKWMTFSEYLPGFLQEYFNCYYGEEFESLCATRTSGYSLEDCSFMKHIAKKYGRRCHLYNLNSYEFHITVQMAPAPVDKAPLVTIVADNFFSNYTRFLTQDDAIAFKAIIMNKVDDEIKYTAGSSMLYLKLYEINCQYCASEIFNGLTLSSKLSTTESKLSGWVVSLLRDIKVSGKYIVNFFLRPIVYFE